MYNIRRNPHETRIVVTGMGTINPLAQNVEDFWDNLAVGKCGLSLIQSFDVSSSSTKVGGETDYPENILDYFPKKMVRRLERFIIFGHIAATQAFKASGLDQDMINKNPHRYGAIIGTGDAGNDGHFKACRRIDKHGLESLTPFYVVSVISNAPSGYFARDFNFQGPNFSIGSACATSNHAIGTAAAMIKTGMADVIITGGTEAVLSPGGIAGFGVIYALSRNPDPQTASRPFDKNRDGFVLSEGAGILCLEELEHAKKRGAKIYAELTGYGFSCDAFDLVAPHPEGEGAAMAMNSALFEAKLNYQDIDLINSHGTSTLIGDLSESKAIHKVFNSNANTIPVHSTKSMIGHLVGASGGVEAISSILAINKGIIHPSINVSEQDPEIDLNVVKEPMEKEVKHVLSNSFGFGGQNSSIILSKYEN